MNPEPRTVIGYVQYKTTYEHSFDQPIWTIRPAVVPDGASVDRTVWFQSKGTAIQQAETAAIYRGGVWIAEKHHNGVTTEEARRDIESMYRPSKNPSNWH
jgi:hypothetical protein